MLLAEYTNTKDIIFGAVITGRNVSLGEIDRLVGPVIATVPSRVVISANSTVFEFLQQLQNQAVDTIMHQHLDFYV